MQKIKSFVFNVIAFVVKLSSTRIRPKTLLIIKTNEIGDYILWRNFLPVIKNAERFKEYEITLLGNIAWKNLYNDLDSIDNTIWVDKKKFDKSILYRYKFLKSVRALGFETLVNVVISRCKRFDDAFVIVQNKTFKIGSTSDRTNVADFEVGYDEGLYDELINCDEAVFEFDKNRLLTEKLLGINLADLPLTLSLKHPGNLSPDLQQSNYFVVFTGSSRANKLWPTEYFAKVTEYLVSTYKMTPVACGSMDDLEYVEKFITAYGGEVINKCGQTSLSEFANILKHAKLLLSVDTGSVHIAAAMGCPVYAIFSGIHLGRFAPYPKNVSSSVYAIYPNEVDEDITAGNYRKYQFSSPFPYSSVTAEKVIASIKATFTM